MWCCVLLCIRSGGTWFRYISLLMCVHACSFALTLCAPMSCSLPAFFAHGIFQARILEWVDVDSITKGKRVTIQWRWHLPYFTKLPSFPLWLISTLHDDLMINKYFVMVFRDYINSCSSSELNLFFYVSMDSQIPILLSIKICYYHYLLWCSLFLKLGHSEPLKQVSVSFWHVLISLWALSYFLKQDVSVIFYSFLPQPWFQLFLWRGYLLRNQDLVLGMLTAI